MNLSARGRLLLGFAAILFIFSTVRAESGKSQGAKSCSGELYIAECKDLSKSPLDLRQSGSEADGVLFNYFLAADYRRSDEIKNFNREAPFDLRQRAIKIAGEIKSAAIALVTSGKPDSELPPETLALVTRLKTLKFRLAGASDADCMAAGDPGLPNAAYNQLVHTIAICPAEVKVTSQDLSVTLAHEIGHAVSPCSMSAPLINFKGSTQAAGACLTNIGSGSDRAASDLEEWGPDEIKISNLPDPGYGVDRDPKRNDDLVRCGVAERVPGSLLNQPAIYRKFTTCNNVDGEAEYDRWIAKRLDEPIASVRSKEFEKYKKDNPYDVCFRKHDERFADSFGALVLAKRARETDMTPSQFGIAMHFLRNMQCAEKVRSDVIHPPLDHDEASERLIRFMKPPGIAALLNCVPVKKPICAIDEATFAPPQAPTPSSNALPVSR